MFHPMLQTKIHAGRVRILATPEILIIQYALEFAVVALGEREAVAFQPCAAG